MTDDCFRYIQAFSSIQAKTKPQVHIFKVGEIIFIETAQTEEFFAAVKGGSGTRTEYLFLFKPVFVRGQVISVPPGKSADVIRIACAIQQIRHVILNLAGGEGRAVWVLLCGVQQILKPIRFREGVGIQQGNPLAARQTRSDVVCGGKAKVGNEALNSKIETPGEFVQIQTDGIAGAIIYDYEFVAFENLPGKVLQASRKNIAAIPGNENDGNFGRVGFIKFPIPVRLRLNVAHKVSSRKKTEVI